MPSSVEFGSREAANQMREQVSEYRASSDDKRSKTVVLKESTPTRIVRRVKNDALGSQQGSDRESAGMGELTDSERESLKRQHDTFRWQQHGFEAMRVKAAMQQEGVTEWADYYEPGEGVSSARSKLRDAKSGARQSRAGIGVQGMRTDQEETGNQQRRSRQTERAQAGRTRNAKEPALLEQDSDAISFLREETRFEDDVFDISFSGTDRFGRPVGSGRDFETLEKRHEQRSERAQDLDEQKHAPTTRDPLKWSQSPDEFDFPGIDTLDPEQKHASRSERAQGVDENERAPIAPDPETWASDMDDLDLPGIDLLEPGSEDETPTLDSGRTGSQKSESPLMADDRDRQASLDIGPTPTQERESRLDAEQSEGLLEDTRDDPGRGFDEAVEKGQQELLDDIPDADAVSGPEIEEWL